MYSYKTINDLKPHWYLNMSTKEKSNYNKSLSEDRAFKAANKPVIYKKGTLVISKETKKSITEGREYKILGHFATLVSTIYSSEWRQFITFKSDQGWTVKMNITNFIINK